MAMDEAKSRPKALGRRVDTQQYIAPWILAADPTVVRPNGGTPITAQVRIPRENWRPGPIGTRVQVVDYDTSTEKFYGRFCFRPKLLVEEPDVTKLASPRYQACNLFATAMATIGQFERALGRRVAFATDTHQIKLVPHAFVGPNAFYDRGSEAIIFGYFLHDGTWVDTSLSYDIVVHEMTHAILDGLRPRFCDPSSPDQAAFHEAFADIVAVLSTLSHRAVVQWALENYLPVETEAATLEDIIQALSERSFLMAIAPQLGDVMPQRQRALRASFDLLSAVEEDPEKAVKTYGLRRADGEPHQLGEVLVAAVLSSFRELLRRRLELVMPASARGGSTPIELVAEEASRTAELLLTVCIQAIDYTPPVHLEFRDYLTALLTVHRELNGPAPRIELDSLLTESFRALGIEPAAPTLGSALDGVAADAEPEGTWRRFRGELDHSGVRFDQIQTDRDEAFRFVFANWKELGFDKRSYVRVLSVRPSTRVSPDDGFIVHETVIECLERLRLERRELREELQLTKVGSGRDDDNLDLRGGVTLILGDHGQVKYVIHKHLIPGTARSVAADRIGYLEELERSGWVTRRSDPADFAELHRLSQRADDRHKDEEAW